MTDLKKLRDAAKEVISRDDVKYLIGWRQGTYGFRVTPHFVDKPEDVDNLIFSPLCVNNLATYLTLTEKPPVPRGQEPDTRKVALLVKGCDSRAVIQQLVEQGLERESLIVLGCPCPGVVDMKKLDDKYPGIAGPVSAEWDGDKIMLNFPDGEELIPREEIVADKCRLCRYPNPLIADKMLWDEVPVSGVDEFDDIQEIEKKDAKERWNFWEEQFSRCIRCYSCRNVCPLCYCQECVLDKQDPAWMNRSVNQSENTAFHLARAFHLAGRCVQCGECERVCPVNIPLLSLNRKLYREVYGKYGYEPGVSMESKPFMASYRHDDEEDFIY